MANFNTIFSGLFGLSQIFSGANIASSGASMQAATILQGGEIAAQGAKLSAGGLRESKKAVKGAAAFNEEIDVLNSARKLESFRRQSRLLLGAQRAQIASTGLSATSKSFLQVENEALSSIERELMNMKVDAENTSRAKKFETQVTLTNLENQARAVEYQGAAAQVQARNRAAEASYQGEVAEFKAGQQFAKAVPTMLGQIFGG